MMAGTLTRLRQGSFLGYRLRSAAGHLVSDRVLLTEGRHLLDA